MATVPANDLASLAIDHSVDLDADVVGQILLIRTDQIDVGDRLRPIDPTWASALGLIMLREGQQTPIEVCRLPGANRWTLVAGGHRHAGAELEGIEYLRAIVVSANRDDRRMREVSENLWRRDLDPIDRAAFIAEAVAIHKRRAGIDPAADGRATSIAVRWQKALSAEASDTNDTMSVVYGWSDEVGAQLGLSARTIERDLLIYRRIAPSLIARLRDARHPVATNATQLRALAKIDPDRQVDVVARLLSGAAKSVGDAIKALNGTPPQRDDRKFFDTVISALQRMSASDRVGLVQSPQFQALMPAEARRLLAPMLRDEANGEATADISGSADREEAGLAGHGPSPRTSRADTLGSDRDRRADGEGQRIDNLAVAGGSRVPGTTAAHDRLTDTLAAATSLIGEDRDPAWIVGELTRRFDGRAHFANGTYELRIAGVLATCTAGDHGLLQAWVAAAHRRIAKATA